MYVSKYKSHKIALFNSMEKSNIAPISREEDVISRGASGSCSAFGVKGCRFDPNDRQLSNRRPMYEGSLCQILGLKRIQILSNPSPNRVVETNTKYPRIPLDT